MPAKWIKYLPHLAAALLLGTALVLAWRSGFQTAYNGQQIKIEQTERDKTAALLAAEQAYAAKLAATAAEKQQWYDLAQKHSMDLAAALQQLDAATAKLKKEIPDAIEKDNAGAVCYGGLGDNGLRLYRKSLGYTD